MSFSPRPTALRRDLSIDFGCQVFRSSFDRGSDGCSGKLLKRQLLERILTSCGMSAELSQPNRSPANDVTLAGERYTSCQRARAPIRSTLSFSAQS